MHQWAVCVLLVFLRADLLDTDLHCVALAPPVERQLLWVHVDDTCWVTVRQPWVECC
jgi:hypothetical protein